MEKRCPLAERLQADLLRLVAASNHLQDPPYSSSLGPFLFVLPATGHFIKERFNFPLIKEAGTIKSPKA